MNAVMWFNTPLALQGSQSRSKTMMTQKSKYCDTDQNFQIHFKSFLHIFCVFSPVLDYAYDRQLKLGFPENCLTKEWIHLWLGDEDKERMEEEGGIIGILSSLTSSFRCSCDERNTQLYQTKCSENVLTVRSVTFKRHTHEASNRFHGRHDSQAV